jgi:hypothetical protein
MGHGRHTRTLFCGILMIVSTIQGITPDSRDLASPLAIALVGPFLVGQHALFDGDDSPGETCQAVRESGPREALRQEFPCRTGYAAPPDGRASAPAPGLIREGSSRNGERPLAPDLSLTLCRLVC